ncbi:MAG: tetratricopeptide repeat protein [Candidatus Acidiferrum sp.]|jgi:tetratricopeptide (TPR) repeat protein
MVWFTPTPYHRGLRPAFLALCALWLFFGPAVNAQQPSLPCTVTVNVRAADGSPSDIQATVSLYPFASGSPIGTATPRGGQAIFRDLQPARYSVEVTAPGYQTATQPVDLQVAGLSEQVFITLTPESADPAPSSSSSVPVLAPGAVKELDKVLEDLRHANTTDARKRLEKVSRTAPSYPDVNYLWGAYYAQVHDPAHAREYWQKTLQEDPRHVFALAALSQVAMNDGDLPTAIGYLERAVDAEPTSWSYQQRLAAAYMQHQEPDKAEKCAIRAIELGKEHAADSQLILAQISAKRNDREHAITALEAFLAAAPASPKAPQVRQWIAKLREPAPATADTTPLPADFAFIPLPQSRANTALAMADLVPPPKWMPPDVDDNMPSVEPGVACPLQTVEEQTGERVHDFINAVNRISATEFLENETIDASGIPKRREKRHYNYIVSVSRINQGMVDFQEFRNGSRGLDNFPENIATVGLPAMVLVFDPAFRDSYDFSCEGLSRWRGGLAWQVHFRQRPDKPSRLRGYRLGENFYQVPLRGRAWININSYQVISMETDILAPIPAIRLKTEHSFIEYAPVEFRKNKQVLWLPKSAELYFDFHGRRMHRRHYFRNYLLFSVDETQQISEPKVEADTNQIPQ